MEKEERPVQIIADHTQTSNRIYANYVQVSVSPIDCTLTFCDVIGPQSEEEALKMQKTGTLPIAWQGMRGAGIHMPGFGALTSHAEIFTAVVAP